MNGGHLSLDLLSAPTQSPIAYDQVFEQARRCLPKIWGAEYPVEELLDDVENYRGLSFLNICQKLKLSIWKLGVAAAQGGLVVDGKAQLWKRIEETGEVIVLHLSHSAAQTMLTCLTAVLRSTHTRKNGQEFEWPTRHLDCVSRMSGLLCC